MRYMKFTLHKIIECTNIYIIASIHNLSFEDLQCVCNREVRVTVVVDKEIGNKGCK